jgi:flagellar hook assembly protein FlgD
MGNYPNPFNGSTTVVFNPEKSGKARLCVFNSRGQRIIVLKDGHCPSGRNELIWDGRNGDGAEVPSGLYWARLETEGGTEVHKMALAR